MSSNFIFVVRVRGFDKNCYEYIGSRIREEGVGEVVSKIVGKSVRSVYYRSIYYKSITGLYECDCDYGGTE